jgi:TPR repeat protein
MKSPAHSGARLGREPKNTRNAAPRGATAMLLIAATGCFTLDGLGARQAEAAPPAAVETPQAFASATSSAATAAPQSAADSHGTVLLPDNASAELRALARNAMAGQGAAENDLGTFFVLGIEVPQSVEQAAYWYRRAADQGVANASYNLGVLLERGLGVPRDPEAAVARFRESAEAGHAGALNALGLAYLKGSGVARDPAEALIWFQRASAGGNPRGAYNVARLYESGDLGAPDPQTAAGWYRVAAEAGNEQARAALARLQAESGTGVSSEARTGFVGLAWTASLLVLDQASPPVTGPDPILDGLAARLVGPASSGPVETAMAAPVSAMSAARPAAAPERALTVAEIKETQRLLARLKLKVGWIDGRVGRRTRAAIAAFQQSRDLAVTRRPSVALLASLRTAATSPSRID